MLVEPPRDQRGRRGRVLVETQLGAEAAQETLVSCVRLSVGRDDEIRGGLGACVIHRGESDVVR